jgi:hypothetical protein
VIVVTTPNITHDRHEQGDLRFLSRAVGGVSLIFVLDDTIEKDTKLLLQLLSSSRNRARVAVHSRASCDIII